MATIDYSSVKPQKPWRLDAKQLALNGMVFFLAILLTPVLLNLTPLNGKLGGAFIFVVLATAGNIVLSIIRQGVKTISTSIAASLIYLATALVLLPLTSVLYTVVMKGKDAVRLNTFTQDMRFSQPDAAFTDGGALHAILGTFEIVLIATIICVPLGVLTALFI